MFFHFVKVLELHAYLVIESRNPFGCESAEILLAWRDEKSAHVECTGTHEELLFALSRVAVGPMLFAGDDHREKVFTLAPSQDVEHRFRLALALRQNLVKAVEELRIS